ncbi:hypothetical protein ACFL4W_02200 [Planctomycetota bacterium]
MPRVSQRVAGILDTEIACDWYEHKMWMVFEWLEKEYGLKVTVDLKGIPGTSLDPEGRLDHKVCFKADSISLREMLYWVTWLNGLGIRPENDTVYLGNRDLLKNRMPAPKTTKKDKARLEKAFAKPVTFDFLETPLSQTIQFLSRVTDTTILIDPKDIEREVGVKKGFCHTPVTLKVENMTFENALFWVCRLADKQYSIAGKIILIKRFNPVENRLSPEKYREFPFIGYSYRDFNFKETPLTDALEYFRKVCGLQYALDPKIQEATDKLPRIAFKGQHYPTDWALAKVLKQAGLKRIYTRGVDYIYREMDSDMSLREKLDQQIEYSTGQYGAYRHTPFWYAMERISGGTGVDIQIETAGLKKNVMPNSTRLYLSELDHDGDVCMDTYFGSKSTRVDDLLFWLAYMVDMNFRIEEGKVVVFRPRDNGHKEKVLAEARIVHAKRKNTEWLEDLHGHLVSGHWEQDEPFLHELKNQTGLEFVVDLNSAERDNELRPHLNPGIGIDNDLNFYAEPKRGWARTWKACELKRVPLDKALDALLEPTTLTWTWYRGVVFIFSKERVIKSE